MSQQVRVDKQEIFAENAIVIRKYMNRSGGSLARGDVVILDTTNSTATAQYVTTTASADHADVAGMVFEACAAANGTTVKVQTWGPTDALKVNGTTNVDRGDKLSTYAGAKIAGQAATGSSGIFATALEDYATNDSAGVVDAFIHVGRADSASAGSVTLDGAYDTGGAGAGRSIDAADGAVVISSTDADNNNVLELSKSPVGAQSGDALDITMSATATGAAIDLNNGGSGVDISGSGDTWSVDKAGAASVASLTASGAVSAATLSGALTSPTITGNVSQTAAATTGNGFLMDGSTVTTGNVLRVEADAANLNGGKIINATLDTVSKFAVGEDGNIDIAGTAKGSDAITATAGNLTLTSGHVVLTSGNATLTAGNIAVSAGKIEVDAATDLTTYIKRNQGTTNGPVVEIEATNVGDDYPALLVDAKQTGAVDGQQITYDGTASALAIAPSNVSGKGLTITSPASGAISLIKLDGTTGAAAWVGANNVAQLQLDSDGAIASGASMIRIDTTGSLAAARDGYCILINDSTPAQATSYALRIVTSNNEAMHVDSGVSVFDEPITCTATTGGVVLQDAATLGIGTASAEATLQSNGTNTLLTLASGALQVGTPGSNYLNIAGTGALTLLGTARQTKKFWLPADLFSVRTGSVVKTAVGTALGMGYAFDKDTDEAVSLMWQVPDNWVAGSDATFRIAWAANANANDVVFDVTTVPLAAGEDVQGGGNKDSVTDTCAGTAYFLSYTTPATIGAGAEWAAGDLVIINVNRDADNVADNLAVDAFFLGLEISQTIDRI